jgi:hypothetical protein
VTVPLLDPESKDDRESVPLTDIVFVEVIDADIRLEDDGVFVGMADLDIVAVLVRFRENRGDGLPAGIAVNNDVPDKVRWTDREFFTV